MVVIALIRVIKVQSTLKSINHEDSYILNIQICRNLPIFFFSNLVKYAVLFSSPIIHFLFQFLVHHLSRWLTCWSWHSRWHLLSPAWTAASLVPSLLCALLGLARRTHGRSTLLLLIYLLVLVHIVHLVLVHHGLRHSLWVHLHSWIECMLSLMAHHGLVIDPCHASKVATRHLLRYHMLLIRLDELAALPANLVTCVRIIVLLVTCKLLTA